MMKNPVDLIKNELLLVIDFQNVYLPGQEWACPSMPAAMENTIRLLSSDTVPDTIFTQFLASDTPQGTWQVYNSEYRAVNENPFLCDLAEPIRAFSRKYQDAINTASSSRKYPVAVKSTYSSLKCPQVLEAAKGKDTLVLTGVVAECCILSTMMEAIDLGYRVIYLYDCISGQTPENEAAIRKIAESFAPMHTLVMNSAEYLKRLNGCSMLNINAAAE